jgi:hypothetical protein
MPAMPSPMASTSTMSGGRRRKAGKTMKNRLMNWLSGKGKKGKKSRKMSFFGGHGGGKMMGGNKMTMMNGGAKMPAVGSKAAVYHGSAKHTSGGLTKKDLMKTKHGRIVSRKKHALGKKALKNLVRAGFKAKKGTFKLFRK